MPQRPCQWLAGAHGPNARGSIHTSRDKARAVGTELASQNRVGMRAHQAKARHDLKRRANAPAVNLLAGGVALLQAHGFDEEEQRPQRIVPMHQPFSRLDVHARQPVFREQMSLLLFEELPGGDAQPDDQRRKHERGRGEREPIATHEAAELVEASRRTREHRLIV